MDRVGVYRTRGASDIVPIRAPSANVPDAVSDQVDLGHRPAAVPSRGLLPACRRLATWALSGLVLTTALWMAESAPEKDAPPPDAPVTDARAFEQPPYTAEGMQALFQRNLSRLDRDHNGFVSRAEIDAAMADPSYRGPDGAMLTILKKHQQELAHAPSSGISLADMARFHSMQYNVRASVYAQEHFAELDANGNGFISYAELQAAKDQNPHVQNLQRNFHAIAGRESRGISPQSLAKWDVQNHRVLVADVDGRMAWTREEMQGACRSLYATANPVESIRPDAIRQGDLNDCYFLASLASLAAVRPQEIPQMIQDHGNGTYTVTFPGDRRHPVTVSAPTDAQLMTYNHSSSRGTWASVMSLAYHKYCNQHVNWIKKASDFEGGGGGRSPFVPNHALRLLTGRSVTQDLVLTTRRSTVHRHLSEAMVEHRPATAWIASHRLPGLKATNATGLQTGHEYSILAYDAQTQTVTVRNPYGNNPLVVGEPLNGAGEPRDGVRDGVFQMSLNEFVHNFDGIAWAH